MKISAKIIDLFILVGWAVFSSLMMIQLQSSYLAFILISFGVPTIYLFLRNPREIRKILTGSLFLLPLAVFFNFLAYVTGAWKVHQTVFDSLFLGVYPFEDIIWGALFFTYILSFYEYFLDTPQKESQKTSRLARKAFVYTTLILSSFLAFIIALGGFLVIPYYYLLLGVILSIVPIIVLIKYPHLLKKLVELNIFFFFIFILHELTALHVGLWSFPGTEFIGWVRITGAEFPLEEFIFFICLGASSVVAVYEYFDDDRK